MADRSSRHAESVPDDRVWEFLRLAYRVRRWIELVLNVKLTAAAPQPEGGTLPISLDELSSGVVLCYLMRAIEPRSIPRIQEGSKQLFKMKENVRFFLAALEDYGLPKQRLFSIAELGVEEAASGKISNTNRNVIAVVRCLEALATMAAQNGFSIPLPPFDGDEEKLKKALDPKLTSVLKLHLQKTLDKGQTRHVNRVSAAIVKRKLALLGGDKNLDKYEKAFTRFQALVRGWLGRKAYQKRVRDVAYREQVAKEILSTEMDYVKHLRYVSKVYLAPLKDAVAAGKPILKEEHIRGIFSDWETILVFNSRLLADLEPRITNWTIHNSCLGDLFLQLVVFMKVYTAYVQNFNHAAVLLNQCKEKYSKFAHFLQECFIHDDTEIKLNSHLDLEALLIMPVQRIPRYQLLLQELVKHTWKDHKDYTSLVDALTKVKEIASYVNERTREAGNNAKVLEIQSMITGKYQHFAEPHRRYVREGLLRDAKHRERMCFLFNDLLVVCKKGKTHLNIRGSGGRDALASASPLESPHGTSRAKVKFKAAYYFESLEATEEAVANGDAAEEWSFGFDVVDISSRNAQQVRFYARTVEERKLWLADLRNIKIELEKKSKSKRVGEGQDDACDAEAELQRRALQEKEKRRTMNFSPAAANTSPGASPGSSPHPGRAPSQRDSPPLNGGQRGTRQPSAAISSPGEEPVNLLAVRASLGKNRQRSTSEVLAITQSVSPPLQVLAERKQLIEAQIEDLNKRLGELTGDHGGEQKKKSRFIATFTRTSGKKLSADLEMLRNRLEEELKEITVQLGRGNGTPQTVVDSPKTTGKAERP